MDNVWLHVENMKLIKEVCVSVILDMPDIMVSVNFVLQIQFLMLIKQVVNAHKILLIIKDKTMFVQSALLNHSLMQKKVDVIVFYSMLMMLVEIVHLTATKIKPIPIKLRDVNVCQAMNSMDKLVLVFVMQMNIGKLIDVFVMLAILDLMVFASFVLQIQLLMLIKQVVSAKRVPIFMVQL